MNEEVVPISNGKLFLACTVFVPIGIVLSIIHPLFALMSGGFSAAISFILFQWLSRRLFGKDFNPPSKVPGSPSPTWSDYCLFLPYAVLFVSILFFFGNIADCLWGTKLWNGWFSICG